jgi:Fe2+ transport system protein B
MKKQNFKQLISSLWLLTNTAFAFSQSRSEAVEAFTLAKNAAPEKVWVGAGNSYYREAQYRALADEGSRLYVVMSQELTKVEAEKQQSANRIAALEEEVETLKQQQKQVVQTPQVTHYEVAPSTKKPVESQETTTKTGIMDLLAEYKFGIFIGAICLYLLFQRKRQT